MTATHKKPQIERELKFAGVDLDQLRSRLLELECERLGPPSNEDNWLLDRQGELAGSGGVLRVRQDGRGALITFKGPASFEGPAKLRRELEIVVQDSESALALFTALGYDVVRRYQKIREEWRLGSETICLDHTPIGDFVDAHPTIKMLALAFLILIGVALIGEGFELHIPKGYIYFAMAFSVVVEMLNLRLRNKRLPLRLHEEVEANAAPLDAPGP